MKAVDESQKVLDEVEGKTAANRHNHEGPGHVGLWVSKEVYQSTNGEQGDHETSVIQGGEYTLFTVEQ